MVSRSISETVDFGKLDLEPHVRDSLDRARELARTKPITAANVLRAALAVGRSDPDFSGAYTKLGEFLKTIRTGGPTIRRRSKTDGVVLRLALPLADSYQTALPFISKSRVWGRDCVTMALLATADPSLQHLAEEAGETVASLQDRWFEFVTSRGEDDHRPWKRWWQAAGVPQPSERSTWPTSIPATYLLTWTPDSYRLRMLGKKIDELKRTGRSRFPWGIGVRRHVAQSDGVFLIRREGEMRGLVARGEIVGPAEESAHWDPAEAKAGKTLWQARIRWDAFSPDEPILTLEQLDGEFKDADLWREAASGTRIPLDVVRGLEGMWSHAIQTRREPGVPERRSKEAPEGGRLPEPGRTADEELPIATSIAGIDSDRVSPDARDHLDVENEANAFARVAASRNISPPLSIGVFGEWGSGKTFFMEKMRKHVERLRSRAAHARENGERTVYHEGIVQIRFNAWHYMETNLWASLVDHIFTEMDKWLRQKERNSAKISALYERLSTARMLKLEALTALVEARRRRKEAEDEVANARRKLASAESARDAVTLAEFWDAARKTLGTSLDDSDREKLGKALQSLGFVDVRESAKELMDALAQAGDHAQRGRLLARSVTARFGRWKWMVALVCLLVVIPLLVPVLMEYVKDLPRLEAMKPLFEKLSAEILALSSAFASAMVWLGAAVNSTSRALSRLNTFQGKLDTKLKERSDPEPDRILQAEQILAQHRKDVEIAEANLAAVTDELEQARSELGDTAFTRLNRFIRDKITDGNYAKHLGIIASVRRDFEELAAIMADMDKEKGWIKEREKEKRAYAERIEALNLDKLVAAGLLTKDEGEKIKVEAGLPADDGGQKVETEGGPPTDDGRGRIRSDEVFEDKDLKFFQRIILYIDDLDRCPPPKVVEVLQACHLLLFFPLFIVVVAVDARWVSQALLKQYAGLLDSDHRSNGDTSTQALQAACGSASPRDYLEKIFQVPYWVRRMRGQASQEYAAELIGPVEGESADAQQQRDRDGEAGGPTPGGPEPLSDVGQAKPKEAVTGHAPGQPDAGGEKSPGHQAIEPGAEKGGTPDFHPEEEEVDEEEGKGNRAQGDDAGAAETGDETDPDVKAIDANPESLRLRRFERDFLKQLAPHAGRSPRTIKRFVNVYRLLRTGLPPKTLKGLVGKNGESRTYRVIIAQLAIVTGAPTLADAYFDELGPPDREDKKTPRSLVNTLARKAELKNSGEWASLKGPLDVLAGIENSQDMLREMRQHANTVKRYSFSARPYL